MTVNSITYPPVSDDLLLKSQAVTTDEAENLKQKETNDVPKPQSGELPDRKRFDTYEKSDGRLSASESGIYRLSEDEDGNPEILFDVSDRVNKGSDKPCGAEELMADEEISQKAGGSASPKEEPETTQCTMNTDKVDAEIKKLKEEKKQIIQQLRKTGGDSEKQADLETRLSQLEAELQVKDNDTYRKQHAARTTGNAIRRENGEL